MAEIIWKGGAEEDLLRIFADLEELNAGAGERFTHKLDVTLQNLRQYPHMAPMFEPPMRRLVIGGNSRPHYPRAHAVEPESRGHSGADSTAAGFAISNGNFPPTPGGSQ